MNRLNLQIIEEIQRKLKDIKKNKEYFSRSEDFSRDRVFTFETVFFIIADLPRQSLSIEITRNLSKINKLLGKNEFGTKSGFSRARQKINWELFEDLNKELVELYYELHKTKLKRWKGFILKSVDGSIMDLISSPEIEEEFGSQVNQHGKTIQGRIMIEYDVLNKIISRSSLGQLSKGEGTVLKEWIPSMKTDELLIYDRLYPGTALQYLHDYYGVSHLMRCKTSHNNKVKEFVASKKKEKTVFWELSTGALKELKSKGYNVKRGDKIKVRMLRVKLDDGEIEILLTNLTDSKKYPYRIFKALYFKRWPVEVTFDFLKNVLQIEMVSGQSVKTIYQDFHGTIFRANIQSLIEQDGEPELKKITKKRVHKYQINKTIAAGILKGVFYELFLSRRFKEVYEVLISQFLCHLEPIRPGRNIPRTKRTFKMNGKFRPLKNYKPIA